MVWLGCAQDSGWLLEVWSTTTTWEGCSVPGCATAWWATLCCAGAFKHLMCHHCRLCLAVLRSSDGHPLHQEICAVLCVVQHRFCIGALLAACGGCRCWQEQEDDIIDDCTAMVLYMAPAHNGSSGSASGTTNTTALAARLENNLRVSSNSTSGAGGHGTLGYKRPL